MKDLSEITTAVLEEELQKRRTKGYTSLEEVEEGLAIEGRWQYQSDTAAWLGAKEK